MKTIWAAEPNFIIEYLSAIENFNVDDPEAFFAGMPEEETPEILSIDGDTATITISGVLTKKGPSRIARFLGYGGTGYHEILEAIDAVKDQEAITTVILAMDTPGGRTNGVDAVYQAVSELKKSKRVIAENHGLIASCGYWIASAAHEIRALSPADETGSIGVVIVAIDWSKYDKEMGIKEVTIVSKNAPKKAPDVSKKSGRDVLQERVDSTERVFMARIAEGRGVLP